MWERMVLRLLNFCGGFGVSGELGRRDGSRRKEGGVVMVWESEEGTTSVRSGERGCMGADGVDGDCGGLTGGEMDGESMSMVAESVGLVGLWICSECRSGPISVCSAGVD